MRTPTHASERFWYRVNRRGRRECWPWTGGTNGRYGVLGKGGRGGGLLYAHRVSYELAHGPIPAKAVIMHTCDNPLCVNPFHLRAGTAAENSKDMVSKGRASRASKTPGMKNRHAKLTDDEVRTIRLEKQNGARTGVLAARFGVTRAMIYRIVSGRAWRSVG